MELEITTKSPTPVYEQIVQQIKKGVMNGDLEPGTSLPAIRALALALGFNQNTVAKAYKLMEQHEITTNNGRKGTCIHDNALENIARRNRQNADAKLDSLVDTLQKDGLSQTAISSLLEQKLEQLNA